jgi:hypothetical protein
MHPSPDILGSMLSYSDIPVSKFLSFLLNGVKDHKSLTHDRSINEPVFIPRPFWTQLPNFTADMRGDRAWEPGPINFQSADVG